MTRRAAGALRAAALLLCAVATPAWSGAWLKEKGQAFLSFGLDRDRWGDWKSVYGEYGWSDRFTVGVSAGGRDNPLMPVTGMDIEGYAFLRGAIRGTGATRIAWQIGAGAKLDQEAGILPQAHLGGAIGHGFSNGWWTNLDLAAVTTFHPVEQTHELRADAALGLGEVGLGGMRLGDVVIEASARHDGTRTSYEVTPSIGRTIRGVQARAGLRLGTETGLRLRIERSF